MTIRDRPATGFPASFALFVYNQERFVREAIAGAFAQDCAPMQIILSDDHSTDRSFAIMQEMAAGYTGPHRIVLNRNPRNLGLAAHFNALVTLAGGAVLVVAAGDDISEPDRTALSCAALEADPGLSFVETGFRRIDDRGAAIASGHRPAPAGRIALQDLLDGAGGLTGATRAYRRACLLDYPPLASDCPTEDTPCLLRCLMAGDGLRLSGRAVQWRIHDTNLSSPASLRQMDLDAILRQYLTDARHAFATGRISRHRLRQVRRWSHETILRRRIGRGDGGLRMALAAALRGEIGPRAGLSALRRMLG